METQYISLNMTPTGVNPCFHISQYDIGRPLGFMIYNGSEVVDLDSYTCTIEATRSDGVAITTSVATDDNVGTFETTATMTNKADKYKAQFVIVDGNSNRIASLPFDMDVVKAAMDENSESIEEDASLYQQYTEAVQGAIAEANTDIQAEENARIAAVNAEATARANADTTLQNNIDAEATARANAITAEATARQTADNTLQTNINAEAATRASADSNLQSQIDQIIAPSGEAPSAAEVQNARIGADGVTYNTLGDAIRTNDNKLKSALYYEETDQLLDYLQANVIKAFINTSTKQLVSNDGCRCVIIKVDPTNNGVRMSVHKDILSTFVIGYFDTETPTIGSTATGTRSGDSTKLLTFDVPSTTKSIAIWYWYNSSYPNLNPDDILKTIMVKYGYYSRYEPYSGVSGYNQIPRWYDVPDQDFNSLIYLKNSACFINGNSLSNAPKGVTSGWFFLKNTIVSDDDSNRTVLQEAYANRTYSSKTFKRYVNYSKTNGTITSTSTWEEAGDIVIYNKMCVAGDSITAGFPSYVTGDHWWEAVGRMLKFDVTAIAQTGAGISYWRGTNACKIAKDTDFSTYDVCVFAFGTNDFGNNIPIGTINDEYTYSEDSSQTFYASLKYVVETIKNKKKDITLMFSLPINRKAFVNAEEQIITLGTRETKWCYGNQNLIGKTLLDYIDAIIAVCDKYCIPYIDHRNGAFDVYAVDTLLTDGLHPTEKGYKILGEEMSAKIGAIIRPYVGYDGY